MQDRKLLYLAGIVIALGLAYFLGTQTGKDTGFSISSKDSPGEIIEEIGDEIDDATDAR